MTVKVTLNLRGLNALMSSEPVQSVVDERGERIAAAAGPNFEYVRGKRRHPYTARGYVQPANGEGAREQVENAVLERALGSARG